MDYAYWFKRTYPQLSHVSFDHADAVVKKALAETTILRELMKLTTFLLIVLPVTAFIYYAELPVNVTLVHWLALFTTLICGAYAARYSEQIIIKQYMKTALLGFQHVKGS